MKGVETSHLLHHRLLYDGGWLLLCWLVIAASHWQPSSASPLLITQPTATTTTSAVIGGDHNSTTSDHDGTNSADNDSHHTTDIYIALWGWDRSCAWVERQTWLRPYVCRLTDGNTQQTIADVCPVACNEDLATKGSLLPPPPLLHDNLTKEKPSTTTTTTTTTTVTPPAPNLLRRPIRDSNNKPTHTSPATTSISSDTGTVSAYSIASTATTQSVPPGPYVNASSSSTSPFVVLPNSPEPTDWREGSQRINCPHLATGLKRWVDATTWGTTSFPTSGNVTIPAGQRVLIDTTLIAYRYSYITIPAGSELIIGENKNNSNETIQLRAMGFDVQGTLTAGSETCRIEQPVIITLDGLRPWNAATSSPPPIRKGIVARNGGTIRLHGKRYFPTWARLAKTVEPGDTAIVLQRSVNWVPGQEIVLVTSSLKDSRDYHRNEVAVIDAIQSPPPIPGTAVVYLRDPVQYRHVANDYYQVEVGLLSRMIKVQGSPDDSEPTDLPRKTCYDDRVNMNWMIYQNNTKPCFDTQLTGYGGHIMIDSNGTGQLQGVELFRMGQTNVMGRYPMHFHLLGARCPSCYLRDSSIHRSYYRCISIHGTNNTQVTENVAFNVTGHCYYLEDGVEMENTIAFNLAAHVHTLGDMPWGWGQNTLVYQQNATLTVPSDVTAAGFYITNTYNTIRGNAASGGWSGFAFPSLPTGLGPHRSLAFRPTNVPTLQFDGNSAHSTGWWWYHAGAFYLGGALYYPQANSSVLEYNAGRSFNFDRDNRRPCKVNNCDAPYNDCVWGCPEVQRTWTNWTNNMAFLTAGVGLNSWSGPMEMHGFACHDCRLSMEALSQGFWAENALTVCRTGEPLDMPVPKANQLEGSGFYWYDTGQSHIITKSTFRNCGLQLETSGPRRGCGNTSDTRTGCSDVSTTFGFLTHSDQFNPEVMQGTRDIRVENGGRRFSFTKGTLETVSGRLQNWLDVDGTASNRNESTLIVSGLQGAKDWWHVEDSVVYESQGPLRFIRKNGGPKRALAHMRLSWDDSLHNQVGSTQCGNGNGIPCPAQGYIRHLGYRFSPLRNASVSPGLPITANPDIVGLGGGFGWLINFNRTAPRSLRMQELEIEPDSVVLVSIPYPPGTRFEITIQAADWCYASAKYVCKMNLTAVSSIDQVRQGSGNVYYVDSNGVLTLRVVALPPDFVGNPTWQLPDWNMKARDGVSYALQRYERDGVRLPNSNFGGYRIQARCPSDTSTSPLTGYCSERVQQDYDPNVCATWPGFVQVAYDKCCDSTNTTNCKFAY